MDDTISRHAALIALKDALLAWSNMSEWRDKKIMKAIAEVPTAQPQWIPCSERLPYAEDGDSGVVLVTCGYKNVEDTSIRWVSRLWFDGECWRSVEGGVCFSQIVYAWMPLPKPYTGGGKE